MDPLTVIHTGLSLVALVAGIVVVIGLLGGRLLPRWSALYLATAVATSATGFAFPSSAFLASHWIGVISLVVLGLAIVARYGFALAGLWRPTYVLGSVIAAYFLVFVAIAQAFQKLPVLAAAAPTLSEAPFAVSQLVVLVLFVAAAVMAARTERALPM